MSHDVPIRVDHIGIAVESIDDAEPVLLALGCERLLVDDVEGRFRWAYYRLGNGSRLELIEPVAEESFLTDYLEREGPGLHHVTLEVADIDAVIEGLEESGLRVVDYEEFEEWTEAFVSPKNPTGVLFQLMEYHTAYATSHEAGERLFVGGEPL